MKYVLLLMVLLLASPALAGSWSKNCQFTGGTTTGTLGTPVDTTPVVNAGNVGCYRYTITSDAAGHNSIIITVNAVSAVIIFDPQLDAQVLAATTALATPHVCSSSSILTAASPQFSCEYLGGETSHIILDGNEEVAATQAVRVPAGIYYFELSACLAGDTCQVSIKGEAKVQ